MEKQRQRHRQREKQASCREPNVGLDLRTVGSRPEPKAGAKLLRHPGIPTYSFLYMTSHFIQWFVIYYYHDLLWCSNCP